MEPFPILEFGRLEISKMNNMIFALASFFVFFCSTANAAFININLAGWSADGNYADSSNRYEQQILGVGTRIVGAEYIDLEYTSNSPSWQTELVLSLNDSISRLDYWDTKILGGASDAPGGFGPASSAFANASPPFSLSSGILFITIYDSSPDSTANPDQAIRAGSLRIEYLTESEPVPEPATLSLFLLGILGIAPQLLRRGNA